MYRVLFLLLMAAYSLLDPPSWFLSPEARADRAMRRALDRELEKSERMFNEASKRLEEAEKLRHQLFPQEKPHERPNKSGGTQPPDHPSRQPVPVQGQ